METENRIPVSITRSQFQANSLKVLKHSEDNHTPVLVTKYGHPTHILVPLDTSRRAQCDQIQVEQYLDDVFSQWGPGK